MRPVDADALKEKMWASEQWDIVRNLAVGVARKIVDEMPTADVEVVVRCNDCRWYNKQYSRCLINVDKNGAGFAIYHEGNFYCAAGEKRAEPEVSKGKEKKKTVRKKEA